MSDPRDPRDPRDERVNPFPGPQPYRTSDRARFHGRETIGHELASTILAHRCVALFGPSGAGKSSVMQAAVIPELEEDFDFRRVTIDGWPAGEDPVAWLLYQLNAQLKLIAPDADLGRYESVEWIVRQAFRRSDRPILIYLDQFEQLLMPQRDVAGVEAFLDWLDRFAERPIRGLHLVLAMREDYLGRFRDRARGRHRLLENGFRLGPMTVGEIVGAVCLAAADGLPAQAWAPGPMRALMLQVRVPGQSETDAAEVQTAFAQIVCRALFAERAGQGAVAIAESVQAEPILHRYLENTLESLGPLREPAERLLEDHLIAADGTRSLLTEEAARAAGLLAGAALDTVLTRLEDAAILRAEQHRGTRYFEIGHDWLAKRVHDRRQERIARAAELERQRRHEAEQRVVQDQLRAAQAETRRARRVLVIVTTLALLALLLGVYAWYQGTIAERETLKARDAEVEANNASKEAIAAREKAERALAAETAAREEALNQKQIAVAKTLAAEESRLAAEASKLAAEASEQDALSQKQIAEKSEKTTRIALVGQREATAEAERQRSSAESSLGRAQDTNRLAGALAVMEKDPTTALALLLEIKAPAQTRGWTPATVEALQRPASKAVLRGHEGYVVAARFSPDGALVATASHDHSALISRVDGKAPPVRLRGHTAQVVDLAFSPDGQLVATASIDGTVRLWSQDGSAVRTLKGSGAQIVALAFSPDGKHITFGANDGSVHLFALAGAEAPRALTGHTKAVRSLMFSPDSTRVVTSSDDGTAQVWSLRQQGPVVVLSGHRGTVYAASFSADSQRVVTAGDDRSARVWRVAGATGEIAAEQVLLGHTDAVYAAEFAPDGDRVVTASRDRTARVWSLHGGGDPTILSGHEDKVYIARFDRSGAVVATVSRDGTARIWPVGQAGSTRPAPRVLRGHSAPVVGVEFSDDGTRIATAAEDGTARVWDVAPAQSEVVLRGHTDDLRFADFGADGGRIITASDDGTARVWTAPGTGGWNARVLGEHGGAVLFAAPGPNGLIYTGARDGQLRTWSLALGPSSGKLERTRDLKIAGQPEFIILSPDGRHLLTAVTEFPLLIDLHGGEPRKFTGHRGKVRHAAFSPDGRSIVTASDDRTARVWSPEGKELLVLGGHEGSLYHVAFSPDGRKLVTASWDQTAQVWSVDGKTPPVVLAGHKKVVRSAEFSHDGARIVTGSDDRTAKIWHTDGTGDVVTLYGHAGAVSHAAFSRDDHRIVTASTDNTARVWAADFDNPELLRAQIRQTTTVCPVPQQRVLLLGESLEMAQEGYRVCERAAGR